MTLLRVEAAVRDRFGLDPGSLGPAVFPRAVEARMRARGVATTDDYLGVWAAEPAEAAALAAELVVPETWFFRGGRMLFDRLGEFVAARAAARGPGNPVRLLSLPCSTGEEPYSLAIAVHERFVPPESYRIDGIDLSPRHLERAAAGRYSAFSFREGGADIRPTYFRPQGGGWELLPHLRQTVRFRSGNVTDPAFLATEPPYDLILCRNLFIYLTPEGRKRGAAALDRLLAADGWLCLTPGEADRLPPNRFVVEGPPEFGIYRRVGVGSAPHALLAAPLTERIPKPPATERIPKPTAPPAVASLATARALADTGHLAEARAACEALVRQDTARPDAHTLLGVIFQAEGKLGEAAEEFRKALYLAPDHAEALTHMIVICDRRGDADKAAALRNRLARLATGGKG